MNIKKTFSGLGVILIPLLLVALWVVGAFHAKKKHNIDPFSSSFFVCWYYGLEVMWHKIDYKELNDDVKSAVFVLIRKPDDVDAKAQLEYSESKKELRKVLGRLDNKELKYVKSGVNTFVDFMSSYQNDMVESMITFKDTKIFKLTLSQNSLDLSKKCKSFGLDDVMSSLDVELDKVEKNINENFKNFPERFDDNKLFDRIHLSEETEKKLTSVKNTVAEIFTDL